MRKDPDVDKTDARPDYVPRWWPHTVTVGRMEADPGYALKTYAIFAAGGLVTALLSLITHAIAPVAIGAAIVVFAVVFGARAFRANNDSLRRGRALQTSEPRWGPER
jgi:hypothetical protein